MALSLIVSVGQNHSEDQDMMAFLQSFSNSLIIIIVKGMKQMRLLAVSRSLQRADTTLNRGQNLGSDIAQWKNPSQLRILERVGHND